MNEPDYVISREAFNALPDYSCTVPTGAAIGKRWRRGQPYTNPTEWLMGEYVELTDAQRAACREVPCRRAGRCNCVGIRWRRLHVIEAERAKEGG